MNFSKIGIDSVPFVSDRVLYEKEFGEDSPDRASQLVGSSDPVPTGGFVDVLARSRIAKKLQPKHSGSQSDMQDVRRVVSKVRLTRLKEKLLAKKVVAAAMPRTRYPCLTLFDALVCISHDNFPKSLVDSGLSGHAVSNGLYYVRVKNKSQLDLLLKHEDVTRVMSDHGVLVSCPSCDALPKSAVFPGVGVLPRPIDQPGSEEREYFSAVLGKFVTGEGVLIGVIDFSVNFSLPDFLLPDGTCRFKAAKILRYLDDVDVEVPCSRLNEFVHAQVDERNHAKYAHCRWLIDCCGGSPYHGTHVCGVAASSGRSNTTFGGRGVAPDASLAFVQLPCRDYGIHHVVEGVAWLRCLAEKLGVPCVVNISVNTINGPRNGSSPYEKAIRENVEAASVPFFVVVAAGNERRDSAHGRIQLSDGHFEFLWITSGVPEVSAPTAKLEVWFPGDLPLILKMTHPAAGYTLETGQPLEFVINPNWHNVVKQNIFAGSAWAGTVSILRDFEIPEGQDSRHIVIEIMFPSRYEIESLFHFDIQVATETISGSPIVELLTSVQHHPHDTIFSWVDSVGDSPTEAERYDDESTVLVPGCGAGTITVGNAECIEDGRLAVAQTSGRGRQDGPVPKPDLVAFGSKVWSSYHDHQTTNRICCTGTSMAAPHVAGMSALALQVNKHLKHDQLEQFLRARNHHTMEGYGALLPRDFIAFAESTLPHT